MTKRLGRPPKSKNGATDAVLRVRVRQELIDYLDSKGNRSEVTRQIIEDAMRRDEFVDSE